MIYHILEYIFLVVVSGLLYGVLKPYVIEILNSQIELYPTAFDTQQVAFAVLTVNSLLFFIIIGGIIGLWVWVHRTRSRGTFYG